MSSSSLLGVQRWLARVPTAESHATGALRRAFDVQRLSPAQTLILAMGACPLSYLLAKRLQIDYAKVIPFTSSPAEVHAIGTIDAPFVEEILCRGVLPSSLGWLYRTLRVPSAEFWARRTSDVAFTAAHTVQPALNGFRIGLPGYLDGKRARWPHALATWGLGSTYLGGVQQKDGLLKSMAIHSLWNSIALPTEGKPGVPVNTKLIQTLTGTLEVLGWVAGVRTMLKEITVERTLRRLRSGKPLSRVVDLPTVERWARELLTARNCRGLDFRAGVEFAYWLHIQQTPNDAAGAEARALRWVHDTAPPSKALEPRIYAARETLARRHLLALRAHST